MSAWDQFVAALDEHGCTPRGTGDKMEFRCPLPEHDDHHASASATIGSDGRVLALCHPCGKDRTEDILACLGLKWSDLYEADQRTSRNGTGEATEVYLYVAEDGEALFEVGRFEPGFDGKKKSFLQRRPGRSDWKGGIGKTRRVLYRLPRVLAAIEAGEEIYVVEGERDVHALEALGKVATCNPGGAGKGKWRPEYAETLRGADAIVIADRDDVGRAHVKEIAESLKGIAREVKVLEPAAGKDVSDHIAAGLPLDRLVEQGSGPRRRTGDISGDAFALDAPTRIASIWGSGTNVLWAAGEPTMIYGPDGVGKTTLVQQLVLGLVGIGPPRLLTHAITRAEGKVLYLALDRPPQAARSMRRMVTEQDREILRERLHVWRGTAPFDLVQRPESLVEFAHERGASVVVIDSLKDVAPKLSDEDTGTAINRAWQLCVEAGIEALSLHHPRKAQVDNKKPKALADVYGSRWLTAGCGSVVLLWGSAGDPVVELGHLKQPADVVGPLTLLHDSERGTTTVVDDRDVVGIVEAQGGIATVSQVTTALFPKSTQRNDTEKARRKLDAAVRDGTLEKAESAAGEAALYRLTGGGHGRGSRGVTRGGHGEGSRSPVRSRGTGPPVTERHTGGHARRSWAALHRP
jgi:5S rRNA maturation endonuclease (ribonuclease M5)